MFSTDSEDKCKGFLFFGCKFDIAQNIKYSETESAIQMLEITFIVIFLAALAC